VPEINNATTQVAAKRRYVRRRNGVYPPLKVVLNPADLIALEAAARVWNRESPQLLAADLLKIIITDKLYSAVLDI
jgi:hypothetical protein